MNDAVDVSRKELNSQFRTPLNYLMWIQDLSIFESQGYAYNNKNIKDRLSSCEEAINHYKINSLLLEHATINELNISLFISKIYDIDKEIDWNSMYSWSDLEESEIAWAAIANSTVAIRAITESKSAIIAVANSSVAIKTIISNATARSILIESNTAMSAIVKSENAMKIIANSDDAMSAIIVTKFARDSMLTSEVAMTVVADTATAMNNIVENKDSRDAMISNEIAMTAVAGNEIAISIVIAHDITRTSVISNTLSMKAIAESEVAMYAFASSANAMYDVIKSEAASLAVLNPIQKHRNTLITTLRNSNKFTLNTNIKVGGYSSQYFPYGLNTPMFCIPVSCTSYHGTYCSIYSGNNKNYLITSAPAGDGYSDVNIDDGVSLRGVYVYISGNSTRTATFDSYSVR